MKQSKTKQNTTQGGILFEALPLPLRLIVLFFGLAVLLANITGFSLGIIPIVMLLLGLFCFGLGLYDASWRFDMAKKIASRTFGFWLLPTKKVIPFDEIQNVSVFEFKRPLTKTSFTEITVALKNGKKTKLAYDKTSKISDLISQAETLQTYFFNRNASEIENLILNGK